MEHLKIKIKKLNDFAVIPAYATEGSAGMDMVAISKTYDDFGNIVYGTGIAMEIPEGYVGLVFPRSSNTTKDLDMRNSAGVIDSDFRGEITIKYRQEPNLLNGQVESYNVGDRVAQLIIIPYPRVEWDEVKELSQTKRGTGGYGSTGK